MEIPDFFGLDIGNHSIKVAQLKRKNGTGAELLHIGSVPTEFGVLDNASDEGIKKLAEQVKRARETAGIATPNCVAAIPESPIFSRLLSIPKVDPDKLEEIVHWEIKPLIPVPLEEVDIAFMDVGEKQVNGQSLIDMYVVAAPKNLTNRFKQLAELAGINLIALETESLANTRAITYSHETDKDIIVFDFGAQWTDLVLARNGIPIFAQTISTGSDALTKAIAADYGIDQQQAEQYKRSYGLRTDIGDGKIFKSVEPVMQIILNEMGRIITYFKERVGDTGATKIYMCGEAAKLPGLAEYFSQKLSLESVIVDPLRKLEVSRTAKKDVEQYAMVGFSVAIGLGLKDS